MNEQSGGGSDLVTIINATGVPSNLRGKAIQWLLRLVGGTLCSPVLAEARENLDTIEGRSRVNMMLAEAVGRQALADPEIIERAKARFISDQFRKQENVEAVAQYALADLRDNDASDTPQSDDVDEDWLNVFSRYAEDASSLRMQQMWGKILAGQIRSPGSYSLGTVRFVSELDQEIAADFSMISQYVLSSAWIYNGPRFQSGEWLLRALSLQSAGLISGVGASTSREFTGSDDAILVSADEPRSLIALGPSDARASIPAIFLTRTAMELLPIVRTSPVSREVLAELVEPFKSTRFTKLALAQIIEGPNGRRVAYNQEVLWETPNPDKDPAESHQ